MIKKVNNIFEQISVVTHLLKWTCFLIPLSFIVGSLVALFLWLLDLVTTIRYQHPWLLYLLPVAGIFIYFIYKKLGKKTAAGNNLIIDEIHEPGGGIPVRMTPLVLLTTIITHLFGGSAGREGTAVQMGGSMASLLSKRLKLSRQDHQTLLMAGIAAGFGAVFGTPLTGAIFALEVLTIGKINHYALLPCFIASFLADIICSAYGIQHTAYHINFHELLPTSDALFGINYLLIAKVIIAGLCFGLTSYLFTLLSHSVKNYSDKLIRVKWLVPVVGGLIIIGLTQALGTTDYLGLGVYNPDPNAITILSSFREGGATTMSWFWKLLFTAITLSMGFKGGEVTPLFFIGAALGNTIGTITGAPVELMAGLGFIAVFAGATNTPIACTILGVELFGGEHIIYYAIVCFTAYYFSGQTGIYTSQRKGSSKIHYDK